MWIIRFNKVTTSDYNFVNRILKKSGFIPRKFSGIILLKASIIHVLQRKSWRVLSRELGVGHIALYNFYSFIKNKKQFREIFHRFIDKRITLFIGKKGLITREYLDNTQEIIFLTKRELEDKLS